MLFDPAPKDKKDDLYDRERELEALSGALGRGERLVLVLGIRRLGKSSLVNVWLNESGMPYVKLDAREVFFSQGSLSTYHVYNVLSHEFTKIASRGRFSTLLEALKRVKGVRVMGIEVKLDWRGKEAVRMTSLMRKLDEWAGKEGKRFVLVFDEAQYLRFAGKIKFDMMIAWAVDNLSNLTFILTGSEVGMLYDFLKLDDPKSPLYGRYHFDIILSRFSNEQSLEFLRVGFAQSGKDVPSHVIDSIVDKFNGIVGWLTYAGHTISSEDVPYDNVIEYLLNKASNIVMEEIRRLGAYSRKYLIILRSVANGIARWSQIYNYLQSLTGPVSRANFNYLIKNLVKLGYLEETGEGYRIIDPVVHHSIRSLTSLQRP